MRIVMKASLAMMGMILGINGIAHGQAAPAGTPSGPVFNPGPTLPSIDGSFQYALSASESIQAGYFGSGGVGTNTNLSGRVEYLSPSQVHPLDMYYGAGVLLSTYQGSNGIYQNFSISQSYIAHGWALGVSDSVSYLPQSPTTGESGIPGTGDLGLQPTPDPNSPVQSVLTIYGKRLANTVGGSVERELTGRTSISGSANYGILRFIGDQGSGNSIFNDGLNSDQIGGQAGINRRLSPLSNGSISAYYSTYTYSGNPTAFDTKGINLVYSRQFSRTLAMSLSAGPQYVNGFQAFFLETPTTLAMRQVPGSLNVAANASLTYTRGFDSVVLSYSRGVNAGSGVQTGARADSFSGSWQRAIGPDWAVGTTISYTRTTGLSLVGLTQTAYGGIQLSRRISPSLSAFFSYTGIHQSTPASLAGGIAYSGFSQSGSFGITYAPRAKRLGQL